MTKIKNTKKGMAKKTLSISLAVAMLATSNVPVWAAEDLFTDGDVAVEAFTAEEAVEVEAPAVEEEEAVDAQFGQNENPTTDSRIVDLELSQHGWASYVTVSGKVLDHTLKAPLQRFNAQWVYKADNGAYRDASNVTVMTDAAEGKLDNLSDEFIPTADLLGKELYLHVFLKDAKQDGNNIDVYLPAGTVSKENLNNYNADGGKANVELDYVSEGLAWKPETSSYDCGYNGKERKPATKPDGVWVDFDIESGRELGASDFEVSYRHQKGNFIDAGSECEVVLTPKNKTLYDGVLVQKYNITKRVYQTTDITAEGTKEYEYTGEVIVPEKEDIVLKEKIRGDRVLSSDYIDEIWTNGNANVAGTHKVGIGLLDVPNYYQDKLPSKNNNGANALYYDYTVNKRNLTGCTAVIDSVALKNITTNKAEMDNIVNSAEFGKNYVHIYDANGKELSLKMGTDYSISLPENDTFTPGETYNVSIKSKGDNMVANKFISATLTAVSFDFAHAHFIDASGNDVDKVDGQGILTAVPYTGEAVTKDFTGLSFADWYDKGYHEIEKKDYKVTVNGLNAGKGAGTIVVEGLETGSYRGAKKTLKFDIEPAHVTKVDVKSKVVFNRSNTAASDYAPTVKVVEAKNTAKPAKTFTLEEGKDYTVTYDFVGANRIGDQIRTTVTIINPNFWGDANGDGYITKADKVFEKYTTISKKSLANCTIDVKGTYTYTGAAIIPEVEVKDANGEVLVKDVDYYVSASNNLNVGKDAVVTVTGVPANDVDTDHDTNDGTNDGIYDPEESLSTKFEITPANAEDVEFVFAGGNTGVTYTGKPVKPTIVKVSLNGNDVTEQFNISYPGSYINVGKGVVVLTPVAFEGHENFVGTKETTFDILPRTLEGTLTVYDKDGHIYTVNNGVLYDGSKEVVFDYDGEEQKFFDAEFVASGNYAGYVTKDDYEIKYVDNVYGGTAHIYVEGKGNFTGASQIYDAENNVVDSVVTGTDYKYSINVYELKDQHVKVEAAEYAAGQTAKPNVTVTVFGQKLVEGTDYTLSYGNRAELTNGKTEKVVVKGIKAFRGTITDYYAVVKRDMAHTDITVTERSNKTYDVVVKNTGVVVPTSEYTVSQDGNKITVTAKEDSKYYTGSQTVEAKAIEVVKPDAPVITDAVVVNGNSVKVTLANEDDGATGYDYVIDTDRNSINTHNYYKVNKNVLNKNTTFTYTQSGAYWVYCHSWVRDENGQKVFSDWSNAMPVIVDAVTPAQPKITKVSVSGSTVKVTYTTTENATGYDVVLGSAVKAVAGEKRPVEYGTLVKKNIMGNTVTATFKNVPAGTYYAGLHAFNRTSVDNKKVFSPWSESKKVTVK